MCKMMHEVMMLVVAAMGDRLQIVLRISLSRDSRTMFRLEVRTRCERDAGARLMNQSGSVIIRVLRAPGGCRQLEIRKNSVIGPLGGVVWQ